MLYNIQYNIIKYNVLFAVCQGVFTKRCLKYLSVCVCVNISCLRLTIAYGSILKYDLEVKQNFGALVKFEISLSLDLAATLGWPYLCLYLSFIYVYLVLLQTLAQTEALGLAKLVLQLAGIGAEACRHLLHQMMWTSCAGLQRSQCRISAAYGL